jgi:hypothetical protein
LVLGNKSSNARLEFTQSLSKFEYFWKVFTIFAPFCRKYPSREDRIRTYTLLSALRFQTRSLPIFTKIHLLFYTNKTKFVPSDIYFLFTPIALAHWIMGDGGKTSSGLLLCTDSFTLKDVLRLMFVLQNRYNLNCSIITNNKNSYRIYIKKDSMPLIIKIVLPHMHSSMFYKLHCTGA